MSLFRYRLQGFFWDHSAVLKLLFRSLRRWLSLALYHLRSTLSSKKLAARVVTSEYKGGACDPFCHPAIVVVAAHPLQEQKLRSFLSAQTETSLTIHAEDASQASFCLFVDDDVSHLVPTHVESLLLVAAVENLEWCAAGTSHITAQVQQETDAVKDEAFTPPSSLCLFRMPCGSRNPSPPVLGKVIPQVGDVTQRASENSVPTCAEQYRSGRYCLNPLVSNGRVVFHEVLPALEVLRRLPEISGPRTVLFLLPYLAVGGAEKLLFALVEALGSSTRTLVVTTEPHQAALGQTVDVCARLTPHVYLLGDWLPREAHFHVVLHLLRRYSVESLVSWNGTTFFYEHLSKLRRQCPELRIVNQLFNHEGGWIEHYSPRLNQAVDLHLAVNSRIAKALCQQYGAPGGRVATIHHGVKIPSEQECEVLLQSRVSARKSLGLPAENVVIVGTVVRLHPQKRPLDVINLARRCLHLPVHFLLVGGGPIEREVEAELSRHPVMNLTRIGMHYDIERIYDALDLSLMTSSVEGLPLFLLETMARGIPCVAPAVGEIPLLLERGGGMVVETPGDIDALYNAVVALLDTERRAEEAQNARRTVARHFSVSQCVKSYESVLYTERSSQ